jgi:hypothetical protein
MDLLDRDLFGNLLNGVRFRGHGLCPRTARPAAEIARRLAAGARPARKRSIQRHFRKGQAQHVFRRRFHASSLSSSWPPLPGISR